MVMLELDKPRELKFSHRAMRQFCALTQTPMDGLQKAVMRYDLMTTAVYCMLAAQDPALTPDQVETLLERRPVMEIYQAAVQAVTEALGGEDGGEDAGETEGNPPQAAGAGGEA